MYSNIKNLNSKIDTYSNNIDKFLHKLAQILL